MQFSENACQSDMKCGEHIRNQLAVQPGKHSLKAFLLCLFSTCSFSLTSASQGAQEPVSAACNHCILRPLDHAAHLPQSRTSGGRADQGLRVSPTPLVATAATAGQKSGL